MEKIKRYLLLIIFFILFFQSAKNCSAQSLVEEPSVLARVEIVGKINQLNLPIYAQLRDGSGKDYVLVVAPESQLKKAGVRYRILDQEAKSKDYLVASGRAKDRQQATQISQVVYDDGQQLVIRASPEETEGVIDSGLDVQRLEEAPMVLSLPEAVYFSVPYDSKIAEMMGKVSQTDLSNLLGNLSGENQVSIGGSDYLISTRYTSSGTPISKATQYAYEYLRAQGLTVSYQGWSTDYYSNQNVIGVKTGVIYPQEIILVTAHLDDRPSSGAAPGADDNASGSVAAMAMAKILGQYRFSRTIRFVLFTGEEQGLLGSQAYASKVLRDNDNIIAVYNLDMIAYDNSNGPVLELHTRTDSTLGQEGDLRIANTFLDVVNTYSLADRLSPVIFKDGLSRGDHGSFWNKGYSAILAVENYQADFNPEYHQSTDRRSLLNMDYFTDFIKGSLGTVAHLAQYYQGLTPTPTSKPTNTPTPKISTPTPRPPTSTPIPTATPTPNCWLGDANKDGKTDLADFKFILTHYLETSLACADQNRDSKINGIDFGQVLLYLLK